jgi:hypothetical protein
LVSSADCATQKFGREAPVSQTLQETPPTQLLGAQTNLSKARFVVEEKDSGSLQIGDTGSDQPEPPTRQRMPWPRDLTAIPRRSSSSANRRTKARSNVFYRTLEAEVAMKHRNELVPLAVMGSLSAAIMVVFAVRC